MKKKGNGNIVHPAKLTKIVETPQTPQPHAGIQLQAADHEPIRAMNNEIQSMKTGMSDLSMQIWMLEQQRNSLAAKMAQTGQALDAKIKDAVKAVGVDINQGNMRLDMDSMTLHRV